MGFQDALPGVPALSPTFPSLNSCFPYEEPEVPAGRRGPLADNWLPLDGSQGRLCKGEDSGEHTGHHCEIIPCFFAEFVRDTGRNEPAVAK